MPGPYTRVASGDPGNSGATSAVTVINAHSDGLEALESSRTITNVLNEGVVNDGITLTLNTTNGSSTVTCTASSTGSASVFTAGDVGKTMWVDHNGSVSKPWSRLTISTYISATQVTLSGAVTGTMTGASAVFGTNNTTAINAVLAAASDGDVIYFPAGKYLTNGGHTIATDSVVICGDGIYNTDIVTSANDGAVFTIDCTLPEIRDLAVKHAAVFTVRGAGLTYKPSYPTGTNSTGFNLYLSAGGYAWCGGSLSRVLVSGFYNGARTQVGIGLDFNECKFYDHIEAGLNLANLIVPDSLSSRIDRCEFYSDADYSTGAVAGILWNNGGGTWISNCHFFRGKWAILAYGVGTPITNLRIAGNSAEDFNDSLSNARVNEWLTTTGESYGSGILICISSGATLHGVNVSNNILNSIFSDARMTKFKTQGSGWLRVMTVLGNVGTPSAEPVTVDGGIGRTTISSNRSYNTSQVSGSYDSTVTVVG